MLSQFRWVVHDMCNLNLSVASYDTVPDDVTSLPCVVVGRPAATPSNDGGVYDSVLEVFVLGRRQQAGDYEKELLDLADEVWTLFGGTQGILHNDHQLAVRAVGPRTLTVAGNEILAYVVAVTTSISTC